LTGKGEKAARGLKAAALSVIGVAWGGKGGGGLYVSSSQIKERGGGGEAC